MPHGFSCLNLSDTENVPSYKKKLAQLIINFPELGQWDSLGIIIFLTWFPDTSRFSALPDFGTQSLSWGLLSSSHREAQPGLCSFYPTQPQLSPQGHQTPLPQHSPKTELLQNSQTARADGGNDPKGSTCPHAGQVSQLFAAGCSHAQQPSSWRKAHHSQAGTWKQQFSQVEQLWVASK